MTARLTLLLALAAAGALAAGCEQRAAEAPEAAQADLAQDERAIREAIDRWLALIRNKDAAGIAAMYTADGALMPPNAPIARGTAAIEQGWRSMMETPGFALTFQPEEIVISSSGDMALDRGTYRFTATPPGGPIEDVGKYVVVWRKVDGQWRAAADIFNSDAAS